MYSNFSKKLQRALSILEENHNKSRNQQKTFKNLVKDSDLESFDEQIKKHKLELNGGKPDAYLIIRAGKIHLDLSYHSMRKVIFNTFGINLKTLLVSTEMYADGVVTFYNPILYQVEINAEIYKKYLEHYTPENMLLMILTESKEGQPDKHFIIHRDKITGVSKSNYEKIYIPKIKRGIAAKQRGGNENQRDVLELEQNRHFVDEMFSKCAIKHHIRSNFTSIVPGIDEDDDEDDYKTKKPEERIMELEPETVEKIKLEVETCKTIDELNNWYKNASKTYPFSKHILAEIGKSQKNKLQL